MTFNANGLNREKMYSELKEIKGINFTSREIDIIACLVLNRGEKKIAALLSISPRTVSAHVRNIMQKLTCNSRDGIIDFIEKSGKLNLLKNHYNILLINATFQNYLVKIGKLYNSTIKFFSKMSNFISIMS